MSRKSKKEQPIIRRNARLVGDGGLSFDNQDELNFELTDEEKAQGFISKYQENVDPVGKFKDYFENSAMTVQAIFKIIKESYKKLVINGKWSEKKFVAVITDIFEEGRVFSPLSVDLTGKLFDEGRLSSQVRAKNRQRRRRL